MAKVTAVTLLATQELSVTLKLFQILLVKSFLCQHWKEEITVWTLFMSQLFPKYYSSRRWALNTLFLNLISSVQGVAISDFFGVYLTLQGRIGNCQVAEYFNLYIVKCTTLRNSIIPDYKADQNHYWRQPQNLDQEQLADPKFPVTRKTCSRRQTLTANGEQLYPSLDHTTLLKTCCHYSRHPGSGPFHIGDFTFLASPSTIGKANHGSFVYNCRH